MERDSDTRGYQSIDAEDIEETKITLHFEDEK